MSDNNPNDSDWLRKLQHGIGVPVELLPQEYCDMALKAHRAAYRGQIEPPLTIGCLIVESNADQYLVEYDEAKPPVWVSRSDFPT